MRMLSLIGRKYSWKWEGVIDHIHRFQVDLLARMYMTRGLVSVSKGVMGAEFKQSSELNQAFNAG